MLIWNNSQVRAWALRSRSHTSWQFLWTPRAIPLSPTKKNRLLTFYSNDGPRWLTDSTCQAHVALCMALEDGNQLDVAIWGTPCVGLWKKKPAPFQQVPKWTLRDTELWRFSVNCGVSLRNLFLERSDLDRWFTYFVMFEVNTSPLAVLFDGYICKQEPPVLVELFLGMASFDELYQDYQRDWWMMWMTEWHVLVYKHKWLV